MKFRLPLLLVTAAALAIPASSAMAAGVGETVAGTTTGTLAISAGTGALFTTNFTPGGTATSLGALTVTDTAPSWTLSAKDSSGGAGHMTAAALGCTGSDATLTNATSVSVTSLLGNVTSAGAVSLTASDQTVASATNQLLAANVFTTHYSVAIPSTQIMTTGCVYNQTVTYTLQ